jgi:hypothetical protein
MFILIKKGDKFKLPENKNIKEVVHNEVNIKG